MGKIILFIFHKAFPNKKIGISILLNFFEEIKDYFMKKDLSFF